MNEKNNPDSPESGNSEVQQKEFVLDDFVLNPLSSTEFIKPEFSDHLADSFLAENKTENQSELDHEQAAEPEKTANAPVDPIFAALAEPKLPELARENRARLQMQSPTRLYFYWSIKNNPYQILRKLFGGNIGNYQLVAKLIDETRGGENLFPVETEGNWWFNVEASSKHKVEIGFYAPNRPFVRIIFSNSVETPRKNPSPRQASEADWAVTATEFAEVLDSSGFARDAFEVALAGDDLEKSDRAANAAFSQLIGAEETFAFGFDAAEVRFALLALASGIALADLREHLSEALFAALSANSGNLSAENSFAALQEHFDISGADMIEEEEFGAAVFGASLVHFPKTISKRIVPRNLSPKSAQKFLRKFLPVSS